MSFLKYLPQTLSFVADKVRKNVSEIRLSPGGKVIVFTDKPFFVTSSGEFTIDFENGISLTCEEFYKTFEKMCEGSPYAKAESLKEGYLTLPGGHRVGVCGKGVIGEGKIISLCDISGLNIRISRQIFSAADGVIDHIAQFGKIKNTLIISPPGCGKTTMLRELARLLGGGKYLYRTGILDERCEIAAMYKGKSCYNIGELSFVYSGIKKADAMLMAIRSMSPDVIICDEIGGYGDAQAIFSLINAGVKIICSCHGYGRDDILRRKGLKELIESGIFEKIIVLKGKGRVAGCF